VQSSLSTSARIAGLSVVIAVCLFAGPRFAEAHAELERALPEPETSLASSPATVEIWFTEEAAEGSTIEVFGPDGSPVHEGEAALDLFDPNRQHVTVSLQPGLPPGRYTVRWTSISAADGDSSSGEFGFTVAGTASPVASPAASPVVSATAGPEGSPASGAPSSSVSADPAGEGEFDSRALAISVGAGLVAAAGIYLFWRRVRPQRPLAS
jgi:methionine-rich copper-binding protein CopC